jgi:parallel beta-helix repeat protein
MLFSVSWCQPFDEKGGINMSQKFLQVLFFIGLALLRPNEALSATYYISSSTGNDNNSGTSESTAWQSLSQLKEVIFEDNTTILFKRADVFRGEIRFKGSPTGLSIGAYGTGDRPVIAGSVQITGWTSTTHSSLSSNVYEADVSAFIEQDEQGDENTIEQLFVNGKLMTIARYPNVASPADKNWLQVGAGAGTDVFTDPHLAATGKPDGYWKGATLRIRNYSWTYIVREITNYVAQNGQITTTGLGDQLPKWGYFLDGKLAELDHPGEWYYDATTKKVYFYPPTGVDPNTALIEGSTYEVGMSIDNKKDQAVIENLVFRHFTSNGLKISGSENVTLKNCHFYHNVTGLTIWNSPNVLVQNNTFDYQFDIAVLLLASKDFDVKNSVIEKNQMTHTAMYPAYGVRYDGIYQGKGIMAFGKAYIMRENTIENSGHSGITLKDGGHHQVENNVIRKSLLLLNDGGAIAISSDGNIIRGNILLESVGNVDESNGCANLKKTPCSHHHAYGMGIGADNTFKDNVIEGNTVANNQHQGIRLNSFINTTVRNNVVYNNKNQIVIEDIYGSKESYNNVVENNVIYSLAPDQYGIRLTNDTNHGLLENNYYCNPYSKTVFVKNAKIYSLEHWQQAFPAYDQNSKWCGLDFEEYQVLNMGSNLMGNSTFDAEVSNWGGSTFDNTTGKWIKSISFDPNQSKMDDGSLKVVFKDQEAKAISPKVNLVENQWYQLSFSIMGNGFGSIKLRINQVESGDVSILEERFFAYDINRQDYNWFFQSPVTTDSAKLVFLTQGHDAKTYWLDNVVLKPVQATQNDPSLQSGLFINTTDQAKTFDLEGKTYFDLQGNEVTGSLTLQPFSSQMLTTTVATSLPESTPLVLTVSQSGNGQGTVSAPVGLGSGIDCGSACTEQYPYAASITLTATPDANSVFTGWSGNGCGENFLITAEMTCTANFEPLPDSYALSISKTGTGSGQISSQPTGIDCGTQCTADYVPATVVSLTASPQSGSRFEGWGGACAGSQSSTAVTLNANQSCTAIFNPIPAPPPPPPPPAPPPSTSPAVPPPSPPTVSYKLALNKAGTGSGRVSSKPAGIECGSDCLQYYNSDTEISLTPTPFTGSSFVGWEGEDCANSFAIMADMHCTAVFDKVLPRHTLTITQSGTGTGQVNSTPTGIACGNDCTAEYTQNTQVNLTTIPDTASSFAGWRGENCGQSFRIEKDMDCTAVFNQASPSSSEQNPSSSSNYILTVNKIGTGQGQVSSTPLGIHCGAECSRHYTDSTAVNLNVIPETGSIFVGWQGENCSNSFTIESNMDCTAIFDKTSQSPSDSQSPSVLSHYTLSLNKVGTGFGQVTSIPIGIECGNDCTAQYIQGSSVNLSATPEPGSNFAGWEGDNCSELITLTADMTCTARFNTIDSAASQSLYELRVNAIGTGQGIVKSLQGHIDCGINCTQVYTDESVVTLIAQPDAESYFTGWSGDCQGISPTMNTTVNKNMNCLANFALLPASQSPALRHALTINTRGQGLVISDKKGIHCGIDCSEEYSRGTVVSLTAIPTAQNDFLGWGGDCHGSKETIRLLISQAKHCTAQFNSSDSPQQPVSVNDYPLTITKKGEGLLTTQPLGIRCGTDCTANYPSGQTVTLIVTLQADNQFIGFSGDPDCHDGQVSMNKALHCVATFESTYSSLTRKTEEDQTDSVNILKSSNLVITDEQSVQMPFEISTCPTSGLITIPCSGQGKRLTDLSIGTQGHVSDAILEGRIINQGRVSNATIGSQSILSGGKISGKITNQGRMENFHFHGTRLTGGTLIGTIHNEAMLKDVHLGANTHITGGQLSGDLSGDENTWLENLEVEAGSHLSNILIGYQVQLPDEISLGKGVRFANNSLIPKDLELLALLPTLPHTLNCLEKLNGLEQVDLSKDILHPGQGILNGINALPDFKNNDLAIKQNTLYGYLELALENKHFTVQPISLKHTSNSSDWQVQDDQSVYFVTDTGFELLAQPAVQSPCALQTALATFGLHHLIMQSNGDLKIALSNQGNWFSARPDFASVKTKQDKMPGLYFAQSPVIRGLQIALLVFIDQKGIQRQQMIYPALAQILDTAIENLVIAPYGVVSFQLAGKNYRGVVDYLITPSNIPTTEQMQIISTRDINSDGINDFMLLYPNSESQILFTLPDKAF